MTFRSPTLLLFPFLWKFCVGTLFCGGFMCLFNQIAEEEIANCFTLFVMWLSLFYVFSSRCRSAVCD